VGSNNAAGYQLASGAAVMAVGAMSGTSTGGSDAGLRIAEWIADNYTATTVDGVTVYDLS
jgi:hypothetical protein